MDEEEIQEQINVLGTVLKSQVTVIKGLLEEFDKLQKAVQNIPEENDDDIVPETIKFLLNEPFFYVDRDGRIASNGYHGNGVEEEIINHKRLFKTYDYAEEFQRKTQFIADLLHFKWLYDRDFVPDFERGHAKYFVFYDHAEGKYSVCEHGMLETKPLVYFSTKEIAQKCADWLNHRKEKKQ